MVVAGWEHLQRHELENQFFRSRRELNATPRAHETPEHEIVSIRPSANNYRFIILACHVVFLVSHEVHYPQRGFLLTLLPVESGDYLANYLHSWVLPPAFHCRRPPQSSWRNIGRRAKSTPLFERDSQWGGKAKAQLGSETVFLR